MTVRPRHVTHRSFDRLRHSERFLAWLNAQADRLSLTAESIFEALLVGRSMTFEQVEALSEGDYSVPENTAEPTITGTAQEGETLTAVDGTWTGEPTPEFTYQWNRGVDPIEGATESTYLVDAADVGSTLTVTVTGTNEFGSSNATSPATAEVIAAA